MELCSPRGEVPWSFAAVNRRARVFIAREDPHSKCIKCLGFSHARDEVYGTSKCKICDDFRLITLRSRLEDCERESSIFPRRASSTSMAPREIAASREAATWGSDVELEEMESEQTGLAFSLPPSPERAHANSPVEWGVGRSMAASVAAERHLWLNSTEIRERDKVFLMDAPISQSGLFGEAVSAVVKKFRSAKTQSAALKQFMPRRSKDYSTPSSSVSREQSLPRKEPPSGGAQATRPSPTTVWGARGRSFPRQQPRKRVNLKQPNKPAASANPGRS